MMSFIGLVTIAVVLAASLASAARRTTRSISGLAKLKALAEKQPAAVAAG